MTVYTKRGDKGKTSLYDPANSQTIRISKDSNTIRAIGALDEVVSCLGVCVSKAKDDRLKKMLTHAQNNLFGANAMVAGADLDFPRQETKKLEKIIDELESKLPPLANFILPSGTELSTHLHLARTVVRRAERELVALSNKTRKVDPEILAYINRLSDTLFVLARAENAKKRISETVWKAPGK